MFCLEKKKKTGLFVWNTGLFPQLSEFWKRNLKAVMKANKMYLMILASVHKFILFLSLELLDV